MSRSEVRALEAAELDVVDRRLGLPLLRTDARGQFVLLAPDGRCTVHRRSTRPLAPHSCRRFPYLLVATPDGGRIGTDHRCPCRTMGDRAPLDLSDAERSVSVASGRLSVDRRVGPRVRIEPGRSVGWARWRALEDAVLEELRAGRAEDALGVRPFPRLSGDSWPKVAAAMGDEAPDTRWGWALRWFSAHVEPARHGRPGPVLPRPWRDAFDRAEARTPVAEDPEAMIRDFVADAIWSMEWLTRGSFLHARLEQATLVRVLRSVAAALEARGVRADRATAEAILVAEIACVSEEWTGAVERFVLPRTKAPARRDKRPGVAVFGGSARR